MARTRNEWNLISRSRFLNLIQEFGVEGLATVLDVSEDTVYRWQAGFRAPNRRFQFALLNIASDFNKLAASTIGSRVSTFLSLSGVTTKEFAEDMGVTVDTVNTWIKGEVRPRNRSLLRSILTDPASI